MENQLRDLFIQMMDGNHDTNNNYNNHWQHLIRDTLNRVISPPTGSNSETTNNFSNNNSAASPSTNHSSPSTNNSSPSTNHSSPSTNHSSPSTNRVVRNDDTRNQINLRQLEVINDLIYEYNRNMREYQKNMCDIIQMLNVDFTTPPVQQTVLSNNETNTFVNSEENEQSDPEPRENILNSARSNLNSNARHNSGLSDNASILLSYYVYPPTNINNNTVSETLTREEIATATRTYGYTADLALHRDSSANVCPISLDQFQVGDVVCEIVGCGHIFKRPSLMNWLRRNSRCPVCRYELRDFLDRQSESSVSNNTNVFTDVLDISQNEIEIEGTNNINNAQILSNDEPIIQRVNPILPILPTEPRLPVSTEDMNTMMMRLVQSMMNSQNENRQSTFDACGNEIYEFDIPINNLFNNSFYPNPGPNSNNQSPYNDPE